MELIKVESEITESDITKESDITETHITNNVIWVRSRYNIIPSEQVELLLSSTASPQLSLFRLDWYRLIRLR